MTEGAQTQFSFCRSVELGSGFAVFGKGAGGSKLVATWSESRASGEVAGTVGTADSGLLGMELPLVKGAGAP